MIEYTLGLVRPNYNSLISAVKSLDISTLDLVLKYNSKPSFIYQTDYWEGDGKSFFTSINCDCQNLEDIVQYYLVHGVTIKKNIIKSIINSFINTFFSKKKFGIYFIFMPFLFFNI